MWKTCAKHFLVICVFPILLAAYATDSMKMNFQPESGPHNDGEPSWSPDGEKILFVSDREGNFDIYVMNADGSSPQNLTRNSAWDSEPAWSPDGAKIVFASDRDGNHEIYSMNRDGTAVKRLTHNALYDSRPAWSPDGTEIAFISFGEYADLFVMNADGTGLINLTQDLNYDSYLAWSPDGKRIAFVSEREGISHILVMNMIDHTVVSLTEAFDSSYPAWSPDGERIAYASQNAAPGEATWDICIMDAQGENALQLTDDPGNDIDPAWSPDGEKILFVSDRRGVNTIFVMNADGTNQTRLTNEATVHKSTSLWIAGIMCAIAAVVAVVFARRFHSGTR
ncbi:MAG: hypothetical protein WBA22_06610 [Candidatus Methanofastidiosia archaeon]